MGWVRPLLIAVLLTQPVVVAAAVSAPYRAESTAALAPGVVHERGTMTTTTAGKQAVYVARIDVAQPLLRLESLLSNDLILGLEPVTQQANRKNREAHRAVVAINGDQFDANHAPSGLQVASGELIAYGPKPRPAFGVTADRKALIGVAGITGSVCRPDGVCTAIARVNQARTMGEGAGELVLFTSRFAETTGTDDGGNEVVLSGVTLPLPSHGSFNGIVKKVRTKAGATPIGANEVVLSGVGTGAKFLQFLPDGARLAITFTISAGWENVTDAVSGPNILIHDGAVTIEPYTHGYAEVASPRTAIGVDAKGNVIIVVVDGRQPGYSMGVTLDELAELMANEGVVDALNLDGGGSATFAARMPGTDGVTMVNRASEGYERPVSNALVVFSTAPTGPLSTILLSPDSASVLLGSRIDYSALGVDAAQNAVKLPQAPRWESTAGTIDASGRFTAGLAGEGTVKAIFGTIAATTPVSVVQNLASLEIAPNPVVVDSGATQTFTLTGRDAQGRPVAVDPAMAEWRVPPSIGRVTGGVFRAAESGRGTAMVFAGGVSATTRIEIGKPPVVLDDFESPAQLRVSATRAAATLARAARPQPVRRGSASLKLTYDMRNQPGISAAGVRWEPLKEVDSRPLRVGLWVYGDSSRHDLRGNYRDGTGAVKVVNFTTAPGPLVSSCSKRRGGIDWFGWKYIDVPMPHDAVLPLKWERIYLVEPNERCHNASAVYFDDLRAVYLDTPEDVTGPLITNLVPAPGAIIEDGRPEIGASVKDESGVEPSSVHLFVDGVQMAATFDVVSGRARYVPPKPLPPGHHRTRLEAEDRAGNPAQPVAEWSFTIR